MASGYMYVLGDSKYLEMPAYYSNKGHSSRQDQANGHQTLTTENADTILRKTYIDRDFVLTSMKKFK